MTASPGLSRPMLAHAHCLNVVLSLLWWLLSSWGTMSWISRIWPFNCFPNKVKDTVFFRQLTVSEMQCQDSSGFLKLCWRLELLLPYLPSLPSVTVYNSLVVWLTNKNYSVVKTRWNLRCDSTCLGTLLAHSHFIQSGYFRLKSTDSPHDWCRWEVNSESSKWFPPASAHHLSTIIMELFCCCLFNFGEKIFSQAVPLPRHFHLLPQIFWWR